MPEWEALVTITFLSIVILITIVGNILVIISVLTYAPLKITPNYFIVSLAVADLMVSSCVLPFNIVSTVLGRWVSNLFCFFGPISIVKLQKLVKKKVVIVVVSAWKLRNRSYRVRRLMKELQVTTGKKGYDTTFSGVNTVEFFWNWWILAIMLMYHFKW